MVRTLAIDPGVRALGWATFDDENYLLGVGLLCAKNTQEMIDKLWGLRLSPSRVVVERPRIYPYAKAKPNDLLALSIVAGAAAGRFAQTAHEGLVLPAPSEWKGSVPKEIHHPRILGKLTKAERKTLDRVEATKYLLHNVYDAVGLGLWGVGR